MTVLVDTSVWIRFLSNRAPYAARLEELLGRGEVTGHPFVYGELLIGDVEGAPPCWQTTSRYIRRHSCLTTRWSSSSAANACTAAVSAGSMRTCWRRRSSAA